MKYVKWKFVRTSEISKEKIKKKFSSIDGDSGSYGWNKEEETRFKKFEHKTGVKHPNFGNAK